LHHSTDYYVAVQAVDASGNQSEPSTLSSARTANTNRPEAIDRIWSSINDENRVELRWHAVTENDAATNGDPLSPLLRELAGYRVYRSESCRVECDSSNLVADETTVAGLPEPVFIDDLVVACRRYSYAVTAVDRCGLESEPSAIVQDQVFTTTAPAAPVDVQAFRHWLVSQRLQWSAVREDVNGNSIAIDEYLVYRTPPMATHDVPSVPDDFALIARVNGATEYWDKEVLPQATTAWYTVRAVDDCVNESDFSEPVSPDCYFPGTVTIRNPEYGDLLWGNTDLIVAVDEGAASYEELRISITEKETGELTVFTLPGPGPVWTLDWHAHSSSGFQQGRYVVRAEVDHSDLNSSCTAYTSIQVDVHP
jgi:hypothetical protein